MISDFDSAVASTFLCSKLVCISSAVIVLSLILFCKTLVHSVFELSSKSGVTTACSTAATWTSLESSTSWATSVASLLTSICSSAALALLSQISILAELLTFSGMRSTMFEDSSLTFDSSPISFSTELIWGSRGSIFSTFSSASILTSFWSVVGTISDVPLQFCSSKFSMTSFLTSSSVGMASCGLDSEIWIFDIFSTSSSQTSFSLDFSISVSNGTFLKFVSTSAISTFSLTMSSLSKIVFVIEWLLVVVLRSLKVLSSMSSVLLESFSFSIASLSFLTNAGESNKCFLIVWTSSLGIFMLFSAESSFLLGGVGGWSPTWIRGTSIGVPSPWPEMPIFNFESDVGVFLGVPLRGSILDKTVGDAMGESNKCFLMMSTSGLRSDANSSAIAFFNGTVGSWVWIRSTSLGVLVIVSLDSWTSLIMLVDAAGTFLGVKASKSLSEDISMAFSAVSAVSNVSFLSSFSSMADWKEASLFWNCTSESFSFSESSLATFNWPIRLSRSSKNKIQ